MSDFLTINGIAVPVADGQAGFHLIEIGERGRAFNGAMRVSRQSTKRGHSFETPPQLPTDGTAYAGLVQGDGHAWSFENGLYSSKGLVNSASVGTVAATGSAGAAKFGTKQLEVSGGGVASSVAWQPGIGTDWTVAVWRGTDGASWAHHVIRSDGSKWLDGAVSVAAQTWLTVSAPNLTIADTVAGAHFRSYDDLIFFPYLVPAAWVATLFGKAAAWPDLPKLTASGDGIPASTSVLGQVTGVKQTQCMLGAAWTPNAQVLSFVLEEV